MSKMLTEIREQPQALERTLKNELPRARRLKATLEKRRPRLIILAARGTSDNAAQFARYLLEITTGIPVSLAAPSVYTIYDSNIDMRDALVVAISQSGESTDTNAVLQLARARGAFTVGITNEPRSTLTTLAEHTLLVHARRERSVAATKTYTGQLLACYLLAYSIGAPKMKAKWQVDLDRLERIPEMVSAVIDGMQAEIAQRCQRYRYMDHAVVVGRGLNYSNAFEFALKLMETCYVVAERFSSADFMHGPIAMIGRSFPAFLFAPSGVTWPGIRDMRDKLESLEAETLVITDQSNQPAARQRQALVLPFAVDELYSPIPYVIPAQLFAAFLAAEKGLNPDRPRTLQKVTRTL
jgi:glucosamine--fructose-6-phosphate aminotransferase (isomerizing)